MDGLSFNSFPERKSTYVMLKIFWPISSISTDFLGNYLYVKENCFHFIIFVAIIKACKRSSLYVLLHTPSGSVICCVKCFTLGRYICMVSTFFLWSSVGSSSKSVTELTITRWTNRTRTSCNPTFSWNYIIEN